MALDTSRRARVLPYAADLYSILLVAGMLALVVAPFFWRPPGWLVVPWLSFAAFVNIAVNLVNHNHTHVRTFGRPWLNRIFEYALTLTRGSSCTFIAIIHNRNHHHFEGSERDWFRCDHQGTGPIWKRPFVYVLNTINCFRKGARVRSMPAKLRAAINREHAALALFLLGLLWLDWRALMIYVGVPLTLGNWFVVLTNLLHHDGAGVGGSYSYLNPLENLVMLNGGYHAMHHLEPGLHWSELPAAHAVRLADTPLVRPSMFVHLYRAFWAPGAR